MDVLVCNTRQHTISTWYCILPIKTANHPTGPRSRFGVPWVELKTRCVCYFLRGPGNHASSDIDLDDRISRLLVILKVSLSTAWPILMLQANRVFGQPANFRLWWTAARSRNDDLVARGVQYFRIIAEFSDQCFSNYVRRIMRNNLYISCY